MYLEGYSVCYICDTFNKENILNRNWPTTTVDKILSNKTLYWGYRTRKKK